jgi:hypothetical protein
MNSQPATHPQDSAHLTTKALALEAIASLPDDADFEDVIGHLQLMQEARRGPDVQDGDPATPEDEARRQLAQWLA